MAGYKCTCEYGFRGTNCDNEISKGLNFKKLISTVVSNKLLDFLGPFIGPAIAMALLLFVIIALVMILAYSIHQWKQRLRTNHRNTGAVAGALIIITKISIIVIISNHGCTSP